MPTFTATYQLIKPIPFDLTDSDIWGGMLNDNFDEIDGLFKKSLNWQVLSKGGNYTVATTDYHTMINASASTASFTITLPTAVGNAGFVVGIKKIDATANTVTVKGNAAELIDGLNERVLTDQYDSVILVSDGTGWSVLASNLKQPPSEQLRFFASAVSGNFTTSASITTSTVFKITITGGGGGGGASGPSSSNSGASGGGAGGTGIVYVSGLIPSTNYAYTIGAAGGGAANGGNTSITLNGTTYTATGGGAGGSVVAIGGPNAGGTGGTATNTSLIIPGGDGISSGLNNSGQAISGGGGSSYWGGGGRGAATLGSSTAPLAGRAYGSGGGGAVISSTTGAAGASGVIHIEWIS